MSRLKKKNDYTRKDKSIQDNMPTPFWKKKKKKKRKVNDIITC